jgi:hypothetical protein
MLCKELLKGAVEIHAHSSPDNFPRIYDHVELAKEARDYGFKGIVLKSQTMGSADRVPFIRQLVPGIDIFGGVVLNYAVGGLNPFAVEAQIRFGARIVWMPTGDAAHHISYFAKAAGVDPMRKDASLPAFRRLAQGITVFDDQHKLLPAVFDILDVIAQANICLSLGHLSVVEMEALIPEAIKRGVKKLVVDHPNLVFTKIPIDVQKEMVRKGAKMVYIFGEFSPNFYSITPKEFAANIRLLGTENVVLASDTGYLAGPTPAEAMRIVVQLLLENGFKEQEMETMLKVNPTHLIYP